MAETSFLSSRAESIESVFLLPKLLADYSLLVLVLIFAERDLPFCNPYLLQNNCETFILKEAVSFPSNNKIVSQVARNIMGLTQPVEEIFPVEENLLF